MDKLICIYDIWKRTTISVIYMLPMVWLEFLVVWLVWRVSLTVDVLIVFCFRRLKIEVVLKKKLRLKLLDYFTHEHASYDLFEHQKLCEKENDFNVKLESCLGCRSLIIIPSFKLAKPIRSHSLVGVFNFLPIELGSHTSW